MPINFNSIVFREKQFRAKYESLIRNLELTYAICEKGKDKRKICRKTYDYRDFRLRDFFLYMNIFFQFHFQFQLSCNFSQEFGIKFLKMR